ncbi:hypothetical protein Trydic_g10135 [Trypoxylus dichotomus]
MPETKLVCCRSHAFRQKLRSGSPGRGPLSKIPFVVAALRRDTQRRSFGKGKKPSRQREECPFEEEEQEVGCLKEVFLSDDLLSLSFDMCKVDLPRLTRKRILRFERTVAAELDKRNIMFGTNNKLGLLGLQSHVSSNMGHWLHTRVILPIITYSLLVWRHKPNQGYAVKVLRKVQRIACLDITGAMASTPTTAIDTTLGLPPL